MTEIKKKALALVNEIERQEGLSDLTPRIMRGLVMDEALCRAIEQHEAFRQEVSDAVGYAIPLIETWVGNSDEAGRKAADRLRRFILFKPDPLVEALREMLEAVCGETGFAQAVRAESGLAYPWPALDLAEAKARAALAAMQEAKP